MWTRKQKNRESAKRANETNWRGFVQFETEERKTIQCSQLYGQWVTFAVTRSSPIQNNAGGVVQNNGSCTVFSAEVCKIDIEGTKEGTGTSESKTLDSHVKRTNKNRNHQVKKNNNNN